ncbi:hypothetical protein ADL21_06345 [Streptomyces albus subsp. albus]|nr:hypothetical protein ADL21_06345 [Streptomyces albus subsp. albus]
MKAETNDVLGWAAMLACIAVTAHGEWSLAVDCGYDAVVGGGLPVAIDAYAIRAMRSGREIFPPVVLMVATNAAAHLLKGGMLDVSPWLVVAVSAIAPVVLWRVHALRRTPAAGYAEERPEWEGVRTEYVPPAEPEAYPQLPRPVPEVVPDGVRTLPIVARPEPRPTEVPRAEPVPALAAEAPRTRPEVHAEYVPGGVPEPEDEEPERVPPGPDPTDEELRAVMDAFEAELSSGRVPGIRTIKARMGVGQPKAQDLQDGIRRVLEGSAR